jgi:type I restriction enzyme M protein
VRPDFWVQTANKQLNFLQHVVALLKPGGRAAVVIPDNVLFEVGAAAAIRRRILESCRVHTLLRLPPGLFYAQGVKSNVLFFDRPLTASQEPASDVIWAYDMRADKRYSLKTKPLQREDLDEFVALFRSTFQSPPSKLASAGERFRSFDAHQILTTGDCRLDLTWDDGSVLARKPGLARLEEISRLVAGDLQRALALIVKSPTP